MVNGNRRDSNKGRTEKRQDRDATVGALRKKGKEGVPAPLGPPPFPKVVITQGLDEEKWEKKK